MWIVPDGEVWAAQPFVIIYAETGNIHTFSRPWMPSFLRQPLICVS